ncbi:MAG TPA: bi-domain-containing oxidoreductase [Bryobacteraceae bacterium]|nr:bi-domain-containing oxidoreductase [Bryobacteraceae bacterium]
MIQNVRSGATTVMTAPAPVCLPGHVLVANAASLISAGTERYVVELARKSLLGKLRDRPDHAKRLMEKVRQEGLRTTIAQARAKLDEPMPLGYSTAGIVLECGFGVQEFKPGDMVATAGPHAGVACVGRNLCARLPGSVPFDQAAYASVGAIALQGLRLANLSLGSRILIIGLGLVGQLAVALAKAQGCAVFGTDLDQGRLALARRMGADATGLGSPLDAVRSFSEGRGVDAVIITAATDSNQPIEFAAEACRVKARIVLVGVAGLNIPRAPFFKKELEFTVSSSLGPGRGDPLYEERGIDYPVGYARWTAQRNMQTVLQVMADGKLPTGGLTTHRYPIDRAPEAYDLITGRKEAYLGIILEYPLEASPPSRRVLLPSHRPATGEPGVSMIGAGNFVRLIMTPALRRLRGISWRGLCTARGMNAVDSGRKMDFKFATSDVSDIWSDEGTSAVFIATRHDLHAGLVVSALEAGKHVFVEKPLCIDEQQLERIRGCIENLGERCPILMVGFNRRFAPATRRIKNFFEGIAPRMISYRFAPGYVPRSHWTQDEEVGGGRLVGEACHAIDTCVTLAESLPVKIYAESMGMAADAETTDDKAFIVLRHGNGSVSSISYQSGGDRACPPERIEVFGGGRTAINDSWNSIELWNLGRRENISGGRDKGHEAEFRAFLQACRDGGSWPTPWAEIDAVTWASLMAVRSIREGVPICSGDLSFEPACEFEPENA